MLVAALVAGAVVYPAAAGVDPTGEPVDPMPGVGASTHDPAHAEHLPGDEKAAQAAAEVAPAAQRAEARAAAQRSLQRLLAETRVQLDKARAELEKRKASRDRAVAALRKAERSVTRARLAEAAARERAEEARRDLGNLARLAYTSGPTELTMLAALIDSEDPIGDLGVAALATSVAEHQQGQWRQDVADHERAVSTRIAAQKQFTTKRATLRQQERQVTGARRSVDRLVELLRGIEQGAGSVADLAGDNDGIAQVARLCRGKDIPECSPSGWGEGKLTLDAVWLMRRVAVTWPEIRVVGGWRESSSYSVDHPSGRAVDIMMPGNGHYPGDFALGDEIATYFMDNALAYGIDYLIWKQRIWRLGADPVAPPSQWRPMADRGSWTTNHFDHIHISVSTGMSGVAAILATGQA